MQTEPKRSFNPALVAAAATACLLLLIVAVAASGGITFVSHGQVQVGTVTTTTTVTPATSAILISAEVDGQSCGLSGVTASCPITQLEFTNTVNQNGTVLSQSFGTEILNMTIENTGGAVLQPNVNAVSESGNSSIIKISAIGGLPSVLNPGQEHTYQWLITPVSGGQEGFNATVLLT